VDERHLEVDEGLMRVNLRYLEGMKEPLRQVKRGSEAKPKREKPSKATGRW
jgi:hypothetical protein